MKRLVLMIIVGICLVGLGLVWNARVDTAAPLPRASAAVPVTQEQLALHPAPTNTPAPPVEDTQPILHLDTSPPVMSNLSEPQQSEPVMIEQQLQDNAQNQQLLELVRAIPPTEAPLPTLRTGMNVIGRPSAQSPQSPSETCVNMILNPQLDVIELGDGTGTLEYWSIIAQKIYFSTQQYVSPNYSLVERDELDGSDSVGIWVNDTYRDYDEFGQGFLTPPKLTSLTVYFSRRYQNSDSYDMGFSRLWTLDDQGYLDEFIAAVEVPTDPSETYPANTWNHFYWELTSAQLLQASNKPIALVFTMFSDQAAPGEILFFDDVQVTLCFDTGPRKVFLPHALLQPVKTGPTCTPREPDGVDQPSFIDAGACCNGSFSATDMKDYFSLNLDGATKIRLGLKDLPPGSNWDALIYENAAGYPLACQIGTPGSQEKWRDCPSLSLSKSYFVLVNAGAAPDPNKNSYTLCALPR